MSKIKEYVLKIKKSVIIIITQFNFKEIYLNESEE